MSLEQLALDIFKPEYNVCKVAGNSELAHTEETKAIISEVTKGKKRSVDFKAAMSERQKGVSNTFFGKIHKDETRRRMSEVARTITVLHRGDGISMLNVETLEVTQFRSIREASRALKADNRSITTRLNTERLFRNFYKITSSLRGPKA